jgi:hypothetical protein
VFGNAIAALAPGVKYLASFHRKGTPRPRLHQTNVVEEKTRKTRLRRYRSRLSWFKWSVSGDSGTTAIFESPTDHVLCRSGDRIVVIASRGINIFNADPAVRRLRRNLFRLASLH